MKIRKFVLDHIVVIIFAAFIAVGIGISSGLSVNYFVNELLGRVFRNGFLVLSLVIPVIAGLGLNFGIVIGAISGQFAIIFVRYFDIGGIGGLMLCFLISLPLAILFGYLTGKLYNKVRGQEMIASLIVGYFANAVYSLILLFVVGVIIPVSADNPLIMPNGIGVRMTVDLGMPDAGGMKYALDYIYRAPVMVVLLIGSILFLAYALVKSMLAKKKKDGKKVNAGQIVLNCILCVCGIGLSLHAIITKSSLMTLAPIPVVTLLAIGALCLFTHYILKTKLGQDFRSVGQSQHIAEVSGINVDRTRIIATIISTVLAAWGMIIYLQNMGTLTTYDSHRNIGLFSVAALLVGGASTSMAKVSNALIGVALFNAMTIISPEIGPVLFGDPAAGEYFREFMVYGVIGLALGLYVWKAVKAKKNQGAL